MLHTSSNRATPTGENITKLVRQHYKPVENKEYSYEKVQCRTDITCQKSKPDDYWNTNYHRRQANMQKGFNSTSTEPYKPIGGQLILDPSELVMSALPGTFDRRINPKMNRRGTIFEETKVEAKAFGKNKFEDETESFASIDLVDTAPSAGFDDIRKLLKESKKRLIHVRAGKWYEDHVKSVEEASNAEIEANIPDDTGMVLKSVSSTCFTTATGKKASNDPDSVRSSRVSSARSSKVSVAEIIKPSSPRSRGSSGRSSLKAPAIKTNKISLLQVSEGLTSTLLRKERRLKDHLLFLKSIFNVLKALHNMKVRDIRSKVPLTREAVEKLQREQAKEEDFTRGTHVSRMQSKQRGANSYRSGYNSRRTSIAETCSELGDFAQDDLSARRRSKFQQGINPSTHTQPRGRRLSTVSYNPVGLCGRHTSVAENALGDILQEDMFSKKPTPVLPMINQPHEIRKKSIMDSSALTAFTALAKNVVMADQISRGLTALKTPRRKSKNATNIAASVGERPPLETWEDLLNVQPEPYKEKEEKIGLGLQFGVITKFMRWYRKSEDDSSTDIGNRAASIVPTHGDAAPLIDKTQLSHLQDIHEKGVTSEKSEKGERESTYGQQQPGSGAQTTERVKKLTIWQQVAQEKSTVFKDMTQTTPNPDTCAQRSRRNLNKLKRNVQKENTVTLEKIVRERVANFRMKFNTLNQEEFSPLLDEQTLRLKEVKDNVNKSHLENFDVHVQPSKWYEELKETTAKLAMISSNNQPEIQDMLTKLQTYAHMDNKTVTFSKAKLCLLVMSLPAYDICQIYMQRALKFIFENILLGQEAQFYEWLTHRKMPYMILSDTRSESPQIDDATSSPRVK